MAGTLVYDPRRDTLDILRCDVTPWEWANAGGNSPSPHSGGALTLCVTHADAKVGFARELPNG